MLNKDVVIRGKVSIEKGSFVNGPSMIAASGKVPIIIGNFCSIAGFVVIINANHNIKHPSSYQISSGKYSKYFKQNIGKTEPINIGNDVWIGSHSVILGGVTIGNGAVIAAGAIVTKDVQPYTIVGGVPAQVIRKRFEDDKIRELQEMEWWNWNDETIEQHKDFFNADFT